MNYKNQFGASVIDAIAGVLFLALLVAIAIPVFIGPRERAKQRGLEAHAKGMAGEAQKNLDAYKSGRAIFFYNGDNAQTGKAEFICYEPVPPAEGKGCAAEYPEIAQRATYNGLDDIINATVVLHNVVKKEKRTYTEEPLVIATEDLVPGHVTIHSPDGESIVIRALYKEDVFLINATLTGAVKDSTLNREGEK